MKRSLACVFALVFVGSVVAQKEDFARWKKAIDAYEKQDKEAPPPKNAIVFTGSSSIRRWNNLAESFPEHKVINRGFGGSTIADCTHYVEQLVLKHEPRLVVLYAGENDLAKKKTPKQVLADFREFVAKLPKKTQLVYISIKLSPKRIALESAFVQTNKLISDECAKDSRLTFADIYPLMNTADGKPNASLYADGLHGNAKAYALWAKALGPHLSKK